MTLRDLTALDLGAAIKGGEVSVKEAVQAALDQISTQDDKLNAFITVTGRRALDRAPVLDAPGLDDIFEADRAAREAVYQSVR